VLLSTVDVRLPSVSGWDTLVLGLKLGSAVGGGALERRTTRSTDSVT